MLPTTIFYVSLLALIYPRILNTNWHNHHYDPMMNVREDRRREGDSPPGKTIYRWEREKNEDLFRLTREKSSANNSECGGISAKWDNSTPRSRDTFRSDGDRSQFPKTTAAAHLTEELNILSWRKMCSREKWQKFLTRSLVHLPFFSIRHVSCR